MYSLSWSGDDSLEIVINGSYIVIFSSSLSTVGCYVWRILTVIKNRWRFHKYVVFLNRGAIYGILMMYNVYQMPLTLCAQSKTKVLPHLAQRSRAGYNLSSSGCHVSLLFRYFPSMTTPFLVDPTLLNGC